jgi:hypothetical protein
MDRIVAFSGCSWANTGGANSRAAMPIQLRCTQILRLGELINAEVAL